MRRTLRLHPAKFKRQMGDDGYRRSNHTAVRIRRHRLRQPPICRRQTKRRLRPDRNQTERHTRRIRPICVAANPPGLRTLPPHPPPSAAKRQMGHCRFERARPDCPALSRCRLTFRKPPAVQTKRQMGAGRRQRPPNPAALARPYFRFPARLGDFVQPFRRATR